MTFRDIRKPRRLGAPAGGVVVLVLVLLGAPAALRGQEEHPLPPPPEPSRVRVELVQVFVTVVDRAGNPVSDLKAEDFTVTEDGKPVRLAVFEPPGQLQPEPREVPAPAPPAGEEPARTAEVPAVEIREAEVERRYVVVLDGFNNPSGLRFRSAKAAVGRFVDERLRPGDQMAVVELRPQMRVLTDLTADRQRVHEALRQATFLPNNTQGLKALIESSVRDTARRSGEMAEDRLQNLARFNQMLEQSGQREFYDNLTAIGGSLSRLPGRKYMLLFSGGFPFLRATEQVYGYNDYFPPAFRAMLNEMARSNTAIYTLNVGDESFGADVEQSGNIRLSLAQMGMDENTLENLGLDIAYFGNDPFFTKQTLAVLAGETGGRFINVPDYDRALEGIDRELLAAYTLGYYPPQRVDDGRFRRIQVKVKRPGMQVQHRAGYFAPKPYRRMTEEERRLQLADAALGRVQRDDLPLQVGVGFLPGDAGDTLATICLEVPIQGLSISGHGDARAFSLDLAVLARDGQGRLLDSISKTLEAKLDASQMPPPEGGLRLVESVTLPPGDGELHVVVRDNADGSMSVRAVPLEVPDYRFAAVRVTSLHLMAAEDPYAVVDEDFVPAAARQRLARAARTRAQGEDPPEAPPSLNPFILPDGSRFRPTSRRTFAAGEEILVFLQVLNLGFSEEHQSPLLTVTFDLKHASGGAVRLPAAQQLVALDGGPRRPTTVVYRLGLGEIEPGEYTLRATVLDKVANAAAQGSEPLRVEAAGPLGAPAAAAGGA